MMIIPDSVIASISRSPNKISFLVEMAIRAIPYFRDSYHFSHDRDWGIALEYLNGMSTQELAAKYGIAKDRINIILDHRIGTLGNFHIEECDVIRVPRKESELLYGTVLKQKAIIEGLTAKLEKREPAPTLDVPDSVYTTTIEDVEMSMRLRNRLRNVLKVKTLYDMSLLTLEELENTQHCGKHTAEESVQVLKRYNLSFRKEI